VLVGKVFLQPVLVVQLAFFGLLLTPMYNWFILAFGEAMRIGDLTLMRIKDGKLVEHWRYVDIVGSAAAT
jgi:hypothetical protein